MEYVMRTIRPRVDDAITGKTLDLGSLILTKDKERVKRAIEKGAVELLSARHSDKENKIILYASYLAPFGGIETSVLELVKHFGRSHNLKLVVNFTDPMNLLRLSEYCDVELGGSGELNFNKDDILILINYDTAAIIPRIKKFPKKIYQQNHAVWDQLPNLHFKEYFSHKAKINAVLSVSEEARRGLIARYGVNSVVVPNIISRPKETVIFGFFSRSSAEKGFDTIRPAIKKFREYGKPFLFLISTNVCRDSQRKLIDLQYDPNVCILKRSQDNRGLIHSIDYLWQLSSTESMGLSVYEALLSGVPVIASKIPTFKEIIQHGKNGYLVERDLSDLPVEEIMEKRLTKQKTPLIKDNIKEMEVVWEKVFNGEL